MGIRFNCSYCRHRLNVKVAQAGQAGQCPHCRQTIQVPTLQMVEQQMAKTASRTFAKSNDVQSTEQSTAKRNSSRSSSQFIAPFIDLSDPLSESGDDRSEILDVDDQDTMEGLLAGEHQSATTDQAEPQQPASAPPLPPLVNSRSTADNEAFLLGRPSTKSQVGDVDPIDEAPDKVWHFRTRNFGARGPIKGKAMRQHLDQGDVTVGSMVWREDWDDWIEAEDVFSTLAEQAKREKQQARLDKAIQESDYVIPEKTSDTDADVRKQKQKRVYFWLTIAGLAIVGALVLLLIKILS